MNYSQTVVGIDIAKHVFQLHWVEPETGEIKRLQLSREKFLSHFANLKPCLIGMESCGGAHHWARELAAMGHQVKLMSGKAVKPFVIGNKSDVHDAAAIWTAVQHPGIKAVAVKSEEQQAILALHRMRSQLVKFRTAQINGLRGLLTEYGIVMPKGKAGIRKGIADSLAAVSDKLPGIVIETLREQWARIEQLDGEIGTIEQRLNSWVKGNKACQQIIDIPGVGLLGATAAVSVMGKADAFKSGREFAAFLGLVPRQTGSGGTIKLLGISKRGDTYLRTLLIHGARAVIAHHKGEDIWLDNLLKRRPMNVAVIALANKIARTIWALLAHGRTYEKGYQSQPA